MDRGNSFSLTIMVIIMALLAIFVGYLLGNWLIQMVTGNTSETNQVVQKRITEEEIVEDNDKNDNIENNQVKKQDSQNIIEKNKEGEFFYERGLRIRLIKILTDKDYGYTDLSSPCGAVRGQVLYNYDGNIYTCDEGRMIEDDSFKIGNIDEVSYEEMVKGETAQTMISASTLENQACDLCPYKPYCGVCPVKNYVHYGTLFPNIKKTEWCKLNTKMFNYIFKKLKDKDSSDVFNNWVS
jgi:radical SAM protein with 4Fe4S-binding SPASM domain